LIIRHSCSPSFVSSMTPAHARSILFTYTTLFRSAEDLRVLYVALTRAEQRLIITGSFNEEMRTQSLVGSWQRWQKAYQSKNLLIDRKSTRLNSSHVSISYAVFCLKKKRRVSNCKA